MKAMFKKMIPLLIISITMTLTSASLAEGIHQISMPELDGDYDTGFFEPNRGPDYRITQISFPTDYVPEMVVAHGYLNYTFGHWDCTLGNTTPEDAYIYGRIANPVLPGEYFSFGPINPNSLDWHSNTIYIYLDSNNGDLFDLAGQTTTMEIFFYANQTDDCNLIADYTFTLSEFSLFNNLPVPSESTSWDMLKSMYR